MKRDVTACRSVSFWKSLRNATWRVALRYILCNGILPDSVLSSILKADVRATSANARELARHFL